MAVCSDDPTAVRETQSRHRLWWVFLACIAIVNGRYLFEPVFWDMITGMFMQAYWLANNNFDYFGLLEQPRWTLSGPCVYPTAWPTSFVYGYLLRLPPAVVNSMGHVLVWLCGATILSTVARILEPSCDRQTRLLAACCCSPARCSCRRPPRLTWRRRWRPCRHWLSIIVCSGSIEHRFCFR